ncbi:hypothetical protein JVT61DRAFT_6406 [Boletus reticuloceps]|uniref:Uncharacterized protein n=1 Tax=Boletus reticuloceps TaxID=495285 RepID=A0A8I2YJ55_9AGAM|nr:hypothetical protein JVT61DRAFT_6406 [Boletus reticuloceps]
MTSGDQGLPEESAADLASWKWLHRLIKMFGKHGMSSEESSVENGVENVLRVKQMNWQRNIDRKLDIIDRECILDCDIFVPQGSKPLSRKRAHDNPATSRKQVTGLPVALYNSPWFLQLTERQAEALQPSEEVFVWKKIAVAA